MIATYLGVDRYCTKVLICLLEPANLQAIPSNQFVQILYDLYTTPCFLEYSFSYVLQSICTAKNVAPISLLLLQWYLPVWVMAIK